VAPSGRDRVPLSEVGRQAQESDTRVGRDPRERSGALGGHAVVDQENVTYVRPHLFDQGGIRRRQMSRYQCRDARGVERAV
jgi:hypothetical protein